MYKLHIYNKSFSIQFSYVFLLLKKLSNNLKISSNIIFKNKEIVSYI